MHKIKQIKDQLAASGEPVSNIDILIYTLKDLSESYRFFQTTITTYVKYASVTIEELYSLRLMDKLYLGKPYNSMLLYLLQITMDLIDRIMIIAYSTIYNSNAPTTINNNNIHLTSQIDFSNIEEGLTIRPTIMEHQFNKALCGLLVKYITKLGI